MTNLIPHFIQEQYRLNKDSGQFKAYTMFIDLSGFTPLTQSLMREGTAGAEKLSDSINQIFSPMVALVYQHRGFIPYFAGDAFTAIFPKKAAKITLDEFLGAAQEIRDLFSIKKTKDTIIADFEIGIKIGLAYGRVDWGIVGAQHKTFYFRGEAIDDSAASEHFAEGGDIIFNKKIRKRIEQNELKAVYERIAPGFYKLKHNIAYYKNPLESYTAAKLSRIILEKFLPKSVINFDQKGEFRNVVSVFCKFEGVGNHERLNQFISIVLEEVNRFSGYFKEIDFGDKGGILLGFFGAPVSFENNIDRALECILSIRDRIREVDKERLIRYRAGITSGQAFAGIVGGKERAQYAIVGNRVNLAARLMISSDWGSILVDESVSKNKNFVFEHIGDSRYKGIEGDIPTYELLGHNQEDQTIFTGDMIGRDQELKRLLNFSEAIFYQDFAGVYYVYGEAGIGKTRLSFELKRKLWERGSLSWFTCQADQILKKSFNPFIYFFKNYFEQSPDKSYQDNVKSFEKRYDVLLEAIKSSEHPRSQLLLKELTRTKSIAAAQIGIVYNNSLWEQLDAKGRYQNTLSALETIFRAEAMLQPVVIELEDGHWFDDDSKEFLKSFARNISDYPIFILVTSRYNDDGSKPKLLDEGTLTRFQIPTKEEDLNILSKTAMLQFVKAWLRGDIDDELIEMLLRITNGNPFYTEQILEYFSESNLIHQINGRWTIKEKSIKVTNSINSILMARIDRLSSLAKETVKAAAVIGREFELPVLTEVMKNNHAFVERNGNTNAVLKQQIQTAERGQIWRATNELRYIFKHSLLREAVYQMQLTTRLRELHWLIADAIEKLYKESIEERYVDLAFHYGQAQVEDKTNFYLEKAADHARKSFQNQQALDFYNTLLQNLESLDQPRVRIRTLLKKGSILQLIGRWDESEKIFSLALQKAETLGDALFLGRANNNLGRMLIFRGAYRDAKPYLEQASIYFETTNDPHGILNVLGNQGTLNLRQGEYVKARDFFTKSIKLSKDLPYNREVAQIISNLGLTYMNLGLYDEGINCQLEGLNDCAKINDKQGMATLHTNTGIVYAEKGDYDQALMHYQKGLALSEELGNKFLTSIAIGCIGTVYQKKGDFQRAMDHFVRDLELVEELGDKQGLSIVIALIGELRSVEGEFDLAIEYLKKSQTLSEELNYKKGIAKAVNTLADIYRFRNEYDLAIQHYDRAISISREINNRMVLCSSLIEKGEVLIATNQFDEAAKIDEETRPLAESLGNEDIIFEAQLFALIVAHHLKKPNPSGINFDALLEKARSKKEQAAIYYEQFKIAPQKTTYRQKALDLYQKLYEKIPHFRYGARIKELS